MSWHYRITENDRYAAILQRCEECCGSIKESFLLERQLRDGQRIVVEVAHLDCASPIELRIAERAALRGVEHA